MCILKNCNKEVYSDTLSDSGARGSEYGMLNRTTMDKLLVRKLYGYIRVLAQRFINMVQLKRGRDFACGAVAVYLNFSNTFDKLSKQCCY